MGQGAIFIGGPDRCGKTTMQAFLASHPRIAIPVVGSNFWSYFYGQFGSLERPENFERCLDAMLHYKHARFLEPEPERIRREFWEGEPSYARLFALFHEHFAERKGKPRWGDQTGLVERYADQIFAAYPNARMIHMIRDPRDRYQASLAKWPNGKLRAGGAVGRWLYSAVLARRNRARYPERYKIVRFETLIQATEQTLREVCRFLDEEYTPDMLAMSASPGHRQKLLRGAEAEPAESPLSPAFIGAYRGAVDEREIAFMQSIAGREMTRFGYELEEYHFKLPERLSYLTGAWPMNLGRMAVWLGLELVQHNLPRLAGRNPSKRMIVSHQASD